MFHITKHSMRVLRLFGLDEAAGKLNRHSAILAIENTTRERRCRKHLLTPKSGYRMELQENNWLRSVASLILGKIPFV